MENKLYKQLLNPVRQRKGISGNNRQSTLHLSYNFHYTELQRLTRSPQSCSLQEVCAHVPQEQASTDKYKELHFLTSTNCSECRRNIMSHKASIIFIVSAWGCHVLNSQLPRWSLWVKTLYDYYFITIYQVICIFTVASL